MSLKPISQSALVLFTDVTSWNKRDRSKDIDDQETNLSLFVHALTSSH